MYAKINGVYCQDFFRNILLELFLYKMGWACSLRSDEILRAQAHPILFDKLIKQTYEKTFNNYQKITLQHTVYVIS